MKKYSKHIIVVALLVAVSIGMFVWGWNSPEARAGRLAKDADTYLAQRDYPQAIEAFQQSLQIKPNKDIQFALGTTLMRAGRRDEAIDVMKELAKEEDRVGLLAQKTLVKIQNNPNLGKPKIAIPR